MGLAIKRFERRKKARELLHYGQREQKRLETELAQTKSQYQSLKHRFDELFNFNMYDRFDLDARQISIRIDKRALLTAVDPQRLEAQILRELVHRLVYEK